MKFDLNCFITTCVVCSYEGSRSGVSRGGYRSSSELY